jgi:hypothetical protein
MPAGERAAVVPLLQSASLYVPAELSRYTTWPAVIDAPAVPVVFFAPEPGTTLDAVITRSAI